MLNPLRACFANKAHMPSYAPVSHTRQARDVLRGTAKTFYFHPQATQRVHSEHPPVGIKRNHGREHTAKGKGLRGLAQRIDKRVVPSTSIAHIREYSVKLCIRLAEARQHGRRSSLGRRGIVH